MIIMGYGKTTHVWWSIPVYAHSLDQPVCLCVCTVVSTTDIKVHTVVTITDIKAHTVVSITDIKLHSVVSITDL